MKKIKLIALIAAVIAALGLYQFLREIGKPAETPRTEVVVAAVDIPENTLITPDMVMLMQVATEALLPGHICELDSAVGMVLSSDVYAGEQILSNRLVRVGAEVDESSTLAYKVDDGMRAVTISVGATSGLSNMIKPGNRVDLVMNYSYEREVEDDDAEGEPAPEEQETEEESKPETETVSASRLLLQNLKVLAVGATLSKDGAAEYTTVTLQTTPEDAITLSFAEYTANLRLVLRSALDNEILEEIEVDLDMIRGEEEEVTAP